MFLSIQLFELLMEMISRSNYRDFRGFFQFQGIFGGSEIFFSRFLVIFFVIQFFISFSSDLFHFLVISQGFFYLWNMSRISKKIVFQVFFCRIQCFPYSQGFIQISSDFLVIFHVLWNKSRISTKVVFQAFFLSYLVFFPIPSHLFRSLGISQGFSR